MSPLPTPSLSHRLEFAAYRVLAAVLVALPERWSLAVGSGLGWLVSVVFRVRRDVVEGNLARAFPEKDEAWRRKVALESYRHLGREAVMTLRVGRSTSTEVLARTEINGLEAIQEALSRGRGALGVLGHLGNWELAGAAIAACGIPVEVVVFPQSNRLFHEELGRTRRRLGMYIIPKGTASKDVIRALRRNAPVGMVADQDAGVRGVFVDFLGFPASTARGPAVFSLRAGAPMLGIACVAVGGNPRKYRIYIEELGFQPTGDVEQDVLSLTQAHQDFVSRSVRHHPEQYFWVHKRWKTPAPVEPPRAEPSS